MPSCVAVARGTLDPLALVRIQARQPPHSRVAQLVERAAVNRLVVGSSPTSGANSFIENPLYLAVTAFGVFIVVKATGVFMIVMGLALGTTGYVLRSMARE